MSNTPLVGSRELVERSIFHSIRQELVDKGYLPDILELITNAITGVVTGVGGDFIFAGGDLTGSYLVGRTFTVTDSTDNDQTYTVAGALFAGGFNTITVVEDITDGTVDGNTNIFTYFNDSTGAALFQTALDVIQALKGYAIEIFGVGSPASRHLKRIPRVVIVANRTLPGDIGGNPDRFYDGVGADPFNPDSFDAKVRPPQTVDFQYDIHMISNQARQSRIMHEIVALGLPKRGYIDTFGDITQKLFVDQYSYRDIPNPVKGIDEQVYLYELKDIFETLDRTVAQLIKPLDKITIEPWLGDSVPPSDTPTNADQIDDIVIN